MDKQKKIKLDGMLIATFLTTLFYSSTYPYIHKQVMTVASDNFIALNQIINCLSIVFFGTIWNKLSDKLFRYYPLFCICETLLGIMTSIYAMMSNDIIGYYMLDTFVFAIVTRNICCGGIKLRAVRYKTEKLRECFDNNNNSVSAISTIIGSCIAMVLNLDFITMLWIATFGNMIDNIFYIVIYYKTKERKAKYENI